MLYRNRYIDGMDRVVFPKHIFHLAPAMYAERQQLAEFLSGSTQLECLKVPVPGRAVYLMKNTKIVLKYNRLGGIRKRLVKHFGL